MRTSRNLLIGGLLVIVLTVASVPLLNLVFYTPARTVEAYVAAVVAGDAERAFSYLSSPTPTSTTALSEDVLKAAVDLPRNAKATVTSSDEDSAKVGLDYTLGSRPQHVDLDLVKLPAAAGLFSRWAIQQKQWPTLDLDVSGSSSVTVNGFSVNAGVVPVLFPATYLVGFDGAYLKSKTERAQITRPADAPKISLAPEPTPKLQEAVKEQVATSLKDCVKSKTLFPTGCVFGYETDNEIIGDVKWSMVKEPQVSLTTDGGDLELTPATTQVRIQGRYRDIVTAAEHDFDEKLSFVLSGSVTVKSSQVSFEPRRLGDVSVL